MFNVVMACLGFAMMIGWIMNLYSLITVCDYEAPYKCEAIRIAGLIVPPVGSVAGYIDLNQ
jgi:hypothetical protein